MDSLEDLKNENNKLKQRINELEQHLKKYTNSKGHKLYYEKNKEKIKEKGNIHLTKLKEENPEKLKEYRRRAYLKRKEKMQKEKTNNI
jgi:cell division septum initiation protein DivIVA